MSKPTLTSRERVKRAIARKPHDRVPRYETFWDDTFQRWAKDGYPVGREGALKALEADMHEVSGFHWPAPFGNRYERVEEDEETVVLRDPWGGIFRQFKNKQTTPEHISWECDSPESWHSSFRRAIVESTDDIDPGPVLTACTKAEREQKWRFCIGLEPFECLRKLIGDEATLINLIEEPEWIEDIAEVTTSRTLKVMDRLWAAGMRCEGFWIYGDMAFNHSTFCSPRTYREIIWPQHKRLCDWAHAHGMALVYHTDGNINAVLDLYIEAGIDVIQPLECKAGMDLRNLVPAYGDKLTFFGNIDVMAMIDGDEEKLENEIREKLAAGMSRNGYIYHSDHSIPPQVSWPLYQKMIGWVNKYGNYS